MSLGILTVLLAIFYRNVYSSMSVIDIPSFRSDEPATCQRTDVDLKPVNVQRFFRGATVVSSRRVHDEYDLAPCYLQGTLLHSLQRCTWTIRPGGVGTLQCGATFSYVVCEECELNNESK